jgi:hypothetical protein
MHGSSTTVLQISQQLVLQDYAAITVWLAGARCKRHMRPMIMV